MFWAEILKNIVIFEISALEFALQQSFVPKSLNLRPKMSDWHIFELKFENTIVIFVISVFEFGTKICIFGGIFGLEFEINIVKFEITTLEV